MYFCRDLPVIAVKKAWLMFFFYFYTLIFQTSHCYWEDLVHYLYNTRSLDTTYPCNSIQCVLHFMLFWLNNTSLLWMSAEDLLMHTCLLCTCIVITAVVRYYLWMCKDSFYFTCVTARNVTLRILSSAWMHACTCRPSTKSRKSERPVYYLI